MRGYGQSGIADEIRAASGRLFAVTSEPHSLAREAELDWKLDFASVGDPHHEVADACRDLGWLDLFVGRRTQFLKDERAWASHPKGYFQPGVLAIHRDGRILYRWRGVPTRRNAGGATNRPEASHVWAGIQRALADPEAGDAALDVPASVVEKAPPWPVFVALQLANGNFRRPRGFGLDRGVPASDIQRQSISAIVKLALFVASWGGALAFLPTAWVLTAFAAWALAVAPSVVAMHRDFQSVREESTLP